MLQTENCSRFWFQPTDYLKKIYDIYEEINNANSDLESFHNESDVVVGQVLAAVYPYSSDGDEFYRAKVIFIEPDKENKQLVYEVS